MNKSEISSAYLEQQKARHGYKRYSGIPRILITGDFNKDSIGEAICLANKKNVVSYSGDVLSPKIDLDWTKFNILIMCHGDMHMDWFEDAPLEKVRNIMDVNLFGSYAMAQQFVKCTINSDERKRIISIGSMAYNHILNGSAAYCASKAGLAMLMKCLAWELAPKGYDVFSIHPSNTSDTPMESRTIEGLMRYRQMTAEQAQAYWNDGMLRERSLSKEDILSLVSFLIYENCEWLSGQNFELAGGMR